MSDDDYYRDRYFALLRALRDMPGLPPPIVLKSLGSVAHFAGDFEEGKRLQRVRGLEAVPPVTECEMGAGLWSRLTKAGGRAKVLADALERANRDLGEMAPKSDTGSKRSHQIAAARARIQDAILGR